MFTRRAILRLIPAGAAAYLWCTHARAASPLDRIAAAWPTQPVRSISRRYRADAVITFLGVTIFSRADVGSAHVTIDQGAAADDARTVALRFAAGSVPERTRGLNRLGFIQEFVVERKSEIVESAYFGFMTSSPNKSMDQERGALGPDGKNAVPYTAVEGSASNAGSAYRLYEMMLPGYYNFTNCEAVISRVRDSLTHNKIAPDRTESVSGAQSPRTFLYAVREAMRSQNKRTRTVFLYNGKPFKLDVEKGADEKAAQELLKAGAVKSAAGVLRLNGTIQNVEKGDKTPFRLWFENGQDLPARFEYKPRGYLSLTFENEHA